MATVDAEPFEDLLDIAHQPLPHAGDCHAHVAEQPNNNKWAAGVDWPAAIWIGFLHAGALASLVFFTTFFTWKALAICLVMWWATGCLGVCLGFHRLLTHGSFTTYKPVRWFLAIIGELAGEGSAITWVANHRKHHAFSDHDGDPHTPRHGGFWAHMLWFLPQLGEKGHADLTQRYAPDLLKDPVLRALHKLFLPLNIAFGLMLFGIGYGFWDLHTALSFVAWGTFVRMVLVLHVTWFVNSATHMWGYRNYETTDDSTNLWWVGLLAFGEGWHNNHHAFQRMAKHGHRWWEFDLTYQTIRLMEKTGLAWNVIHEIPAHTRPA